MSFGQPDKTVLSIKLARAQTDPDPLVEHVELQSSSMRHRIVTTSADRRLEAVLSRELAEYVAHLLERVTAPTMIYTDPDVAFQSADLRLSGVQIVSTVCATGSVNLVVRFVHMIGDVQAILADFISAAQAETKAIAVEAIERVVGRTYDVAFVYEQMRDYAPPMTRFNGVTRDINSKREELLFRLDLLQRAVEESHHADARRPRPAISDLNGSWAKLLGSAEKATA